MAIRKEPHRIRAIPCKIAKCDVDGWRDMLRELSYEVQRIHNDVCLAWLHWHVEHGNDLAVRAWMAAYREAKKANPKTKVAKCPVEPWPNEFGRKLFAYLAERHPTVHKTVRNLASNKLRKTLTNHPQSGGPWKRWLVTLAGEGEMPTFSRQMPVPFSSENGTLEKDGENYRFVLRLDRVPIEDRKAGKSTTLRFDLVAGGRKNQSMRAIFDRILSGEYSWKGSAVKWDDGWFIDLVYQLPVLPKAAVDAAKRAVLHPSRLRPVKLRLQGGHSEGLRRRGDLVRFRLRSLSAQFKSRAEAYRRLSSAGKGHGRKRATQAWRVKLARARQDFKDSYNKQLCRDVVNRCIQAGVGTVVWFQPEGDFKASRFLESCGKLGEWDQKAPGWDWYQISSLLSRYCEEQGLVFQCRKRGNGKASTGLRKTR